MNGKFKCKLKDLIHDLIELDTATITFDTAGVGIAIAEELRKNGILVYNSYGKLK